MTALTAEIARLRGLAEKATPGPWDYVPSTEYHGPYVTSEFGATICDLYTMTQPSMLSGANRGPSRPVSFMHEMADPNAGLIAALSPSVVLALLDVAEAAGRVAAHPYENVDKLEDALAALQKELTT